MIPLEDEAVDVIAKARRGLGWSKEAFAQLAGVSVDALSRPDAEMNAEMLERVASLLGLNAKALAGLAAYHPEPVNVERLAMVTTDFGGMKVNAYLAWDGPGGEAVAFDTGADAGPMLALLQRRKLKLAAIFLTHTHADHVAGLEELVRRTGAPVYGSRRESWVGVEGFEPGRRFQIGGPKGLTIGTRLTCGHSIGGITYVVEGLPRQVAVVGDALFAGSMGGGKVSYAEALATNRAEIFTLPAETVLCPGHGPMTTVGEELRHNPFFARLP
jgi:glyoxylase-like metal-dependent hydrolase (beta-lactamase superfamily II)